LAIKGYAAHKEKLATKAHRARKVQLEKKD
jgi:hypothetical protein